MFIERFGGQRFYHLIDKHLGAWNLFDVEFSFIDQLSNIMVLDVNMLDLILALRIFGQIDVYFIIIM